MYDAVARHVSIEKMVTRSTRSVPERKYYRFRRAKWYGGIATADCSGCGLLCRFCWVEDRKLSRPGEVGQFYTAEQVASNLISIAEREGYNQLRISGGEPTVGREHLVQVLLRLQARKMTFILETNGILLGHEADYAEDLARFPFLHVRVSIKGCTAEDFSKLTGAKRDGFNLQLQALRRLVEAGVSCHPSVMASFSTSDDMRKICESLGAIDPSLKDELEVEELILYPHVQRRLEKYRIRQYQSYDPRRVPRELV